jgi:hypothetical protein
VALQGTIETFALPDVMRLLASTKKTGCLRLTGTRGSGSVWVDSGTIVASEASRARHAESAVDVFFELLRFTDGDFVFDADVTADSPGSAAEVEPTLDEAEKMLVEWKAIEAVVPSLDAWVELAPELTDDEITLDRARWRALVAVAAGTSVGDLGDQFDLGELAISRQGKELVDAGLVQVGERPAEVSPRLDSPVAEPSALEPVDEYEPTGSSLQFESAPAVATDPVPTFDEAVAPEPDELVPEEPDFGQDLPPLRLADNGHNGFDSLDHEVMVGEPETVPSAPASFDTDPTDAAEIARQLANLSPKAAKAVAAAAKATTVEEREAALAEVDDDEDPINRELLIKFLGSVSS